MDSIFHGRSLVPLFEISRPPLKPPWSTCLSEIDSNQACQDCMISGVGFLNPKCRNINFFISLSLLMGVLKGMPARRVSLTLFFPRSLISFSYFALFRRRKQTRHLTKSSPDTAAGHLTHRA